jgi:hypothetical protein
MDRFLTHLADKRAKLQKQLRKLEADLADLDKAERLYRESGASALVVPPPPPQPPQSLGHLFTPTVLPPPPVFVPSEGTIKQRVVALLEKNPGGLTSGQILNVLRNTGLPGLMRESLSPQLSRLKRDEEIDLDTTTSLWTRVQKHETQGA